MVLSEGVKMAKTNTVEFEGGGVKVKVKPNRSDRPKPTYNCVDQRFDVEVTVGSQKVRMTEGKAIQLQALLNCAVAFIRLEES